jgi:hypothetical protein
MPAQPVCIEHTAHGFAGLASACAARDCAALRVSAHRSGHRSRAHVTARSPVALPWRRWSKGRCLSIHGGEPTHRASGWRRQLTVASYRREGWKTGTVAAFSEEVGASVAGGVLHRGGEGEEAQAQVYPEKKAARGVGARGSTHRGGVHDGGGGRTAAVARSDNDVVGFGHGRRRGRDGRARGEARAVSAVRRRLRTRLVGNGQSERLLTHLGASRHHHPRQPTRSRCEAILPLTAGPHTSAFFLY